MTDMTAAVEAVREHGGTVLIGRIHTAPALFRVCLAVDGTHYHVDRRQPFVALLRAWMDAHDAGKLPDPIAALATVGVEVAHRQWEQERAGGAR
jgi:hypothetical protein